MLVDIEAAAEAQDNSDNETLLDLLVEYIVTKGAGCWVRVG